MTDRPDPLPPRISPSARRVAELLKERGELSLAELARLLGISKVGALHHLVPLEQEQVVVREYRPGGVGRPQVFFRLALPHGGLFPTAYRDVSQHALSFVEDRLGRSAVAELFQSRAGEFIAEHGAELRTGPLGDRVDRLAKLRDRSGYMASCGRKGGAVEMLERNCPILALAERFPEACEVERRMFESVLGARVETSHRVVAGDAVCRFLIRPRPEKP
jgi:predicted ArsR family transcriptional regulator